MVLFICSRNFSNLSRVAKFASKKQKETLQKRLIVEKKNKLFDGMNSYNTNYLEIDKPSEKALELKPVQHPINLNSQDSSIISYKVPPKNLTPYYEIPNQALAQIDIEQFEQPLGAKQLQVCILGAPNAGKSSILNYITGRTISPVSNKYNTTDEAITGIYTDYDLKTQLHLVDTPGVTKANNSLKSKLLVSKAWDKIEDSDMVMFVVDSVKKLDMEVKESILRLKKIKIDPENKKVMDAILDDSFSEERFMKGDYSMSEQEKNLQTYTLPALLVMNKVDLVSNKSKFRDLQNELEDLGEFEKIMHVSAATGFGMDTLRSYLLSRAKDRKWNHHPEVKSTQSEVEKAEAAMKQAVFEKFFKEVPYQMGIKVTGWVPKLNGELRIDIALDVKNDVQVGMVLGEKGRILKELRERATQILIENIQRPVSMFVEVKVRRNKIEIQNRFDSFERIVKKN